MLIKLIFGINSKFSIVGFRDLDSLMQRIAEKKTIILCGSSLLRHGLAFGFLQRTFHSVFYKMWSIHVPYLHLMKRRVVWRSHAQLQEHVRCTTFSFQFHSFRSTLSTLGSCISERKGQKPYYVKIFSLTGHPERLSAAVSCSLANKLSLYLSTHRFGLDV